MARQSETMDSTWHVPAPASPVTMHLTESPEAGDAGLADGTAGNTSVPGKGQKRSQSLRIEEGDVQEAEKGQHRGSFGRKVEGLRQRAKNRGHGANGTNVYSTDPNKPPERHYSTGITGFVQRVATVGFDHLHFPCVALPILTGLS